ncbi:MAG: class I SAM-dependent methyltransferase [Patescibacteria group bacterium]
MNKQRQEDIKQHFEKLYQSGVTPWTDHPLEPALAYYMTYLKEKKPNAKILDLGCGDGWISVQAAKASFETWGIDSSPTAIESAKKRAQKERLDTKTHFLVGDALDLPYEDNFFDALVDRGLFHHVLVENRQAYLNNVVRVLKKKSVMYLAVFSDKNSMGIGQMFTKKSVSDLFGDRFSIVYFQQDPYPTSAPAHLIHFILKRKQP